MTTHISRREGDFRGIEYVEMSSEDKRGSGLIEWSLKGHSPRLTEYYAVENEGSLEAARARIRQAVLAWQIIPPDVPRP